MFEKFMQRFTKFLDPKLEKFRRPAPPVAPAKPQPYTPTTLADFIGVLQRTPKDILSSRDRSRIAAIMNFDERTVADLMTPKADLVFVKEKDFLGPLTLDKLYKSGCTHFPVVDSKEKVKGILHTAALNNLEVKKTDRAEKYLDQNVHFLHTTDSLARAVEEIEHTNSTYFLVLDDSGALAGAFTLALLLKYLLDV